MECKEVVELIPAYVKGELTRNQMNEVSEHLQNCNSCYEEAEKWEELFAELRSLVNYTHKPEKKVAQLTRGKTSSLTPWIVGGVGLGVGVLLAAGGALLWRKK